MKKKFNILIRTSGGNTVRTELGFGHIFRTCNLAKFLNTQHIFFLIEDYGGAENIIKKNGFSKIKKIKTKISTTDDISRTINFIKKNNIDLLIIDKYKLKKTYVSKLSEIVKVVVISDLRNIDYKANIVFNGFIGYKNRFSYNKFNTPCYLGPKFQILNHGFAKTSLRKKTIFLIATFGGSDENRIIPILLKCLESYISKIKIKIILGPGTNLDSVISYYKKIYGKNLIIIQETNQMFSEIKTAKYGLCSGGITSYEIASCHIPFGIISQVEHQLITAIEWEKKHLAMNLGIINKHTEQKILNFLDKIYSNQHGLNYDSSIVDGKGVKRTAKIIISLLRTDNIYKNILNEV